MRSAGEKTPGLRSKTRSARAAATASASGSIRSEAVGAESGVASAGERAGGQALLLRYCLMRFLVLSMIITSAALGQGTDFSKVQIRVRHVGGSVHMLEGSGGNIAASVGEDGVALVDDQFAPLVPKIEAALRGLSSKPADVMVIPGHGPVTGVAELRKYRGMLEEVAAVVRKNLAGALRRHLRALRQLGPGAIVDDRYAKFRKIGPVTQPGANGA